MRLPEFWTLLSCLSFKWVDRSVDFLSSFVLCEYCCLPLFSYNCSENYMTRRREDICKLPPSRRIPSLKQGLISLLLLRRQDEAFKLFSTMKPGVLVSIIYCIFEKHSPAN